MKKMILMSVALLATPVYAAPAGHEQTVQQLLAEAEITCPELRNAGWEGRLPQGEAAAIRNAAKSSGFTERDTRIMMALCSMYHQGRMEAYADAAHDLEQH